MNYLIIKKIKIMRRRIISWPAPLIPLFILAVIALLSFIVMSLWNTVLVAVLHVSGINFWQALGILVLAKILFGGFPRGWHGRHHYNDPNHQWRREMLSKWKTMTPEEREKFKHEWRDRCRGIKREDVDQKTNAGIE
jgi:hypothetical protein